MEKKSNLPFKVGDEVEARSFQKGYRGAWFRCKIREMCKKQGRDAHLLEYYDFPDEKLNLLRLYQVSLHTCSKSKEKIKELMLRPQYPPICNEKQMPQASDFSEVAVIVDNSWKVGDLVDWWSDGCYWCGKILQLFGDDKAQIELNPPPLGEGGLYEIFLKDVRPSLDWSPGQGWSLAKHYQEGDSGSPCARITKPINQGVNDACRIPSNSAVSDEEAKSIRTGEKRKRPLEEDNNETEEKNRSTKYRACSLNFDTVEGTIMVFEEYINKIKWLKNVLRHGVSSPGLPQWESVAQNPKS